MSQTSFLQMDGEWNGPVFRANLNSNLYAQITQSAGNTPPSPTVAYMLWKDTSQDPPVWKERNALNTDWNILGAFKNSTFYGSITGSCATANKLTTARGISFTGAATGAVSFDGSADVSANLTLADSGVTAGTYGGANTIPVVSVNSKGLVTVASTVAITYPVSSWNGRTGAISLQSSDVLGVLPSRAGNAGKYLTVNDAETGVEWKSSPRSTTILDVNGGTAHNFTTSDNGKLLIARLYNAAPYTFQWGLMNSLPEGWSCTVKGFVQGNDAQAITFSFIRETGAAILGFSTDYSTSTTATTMLPSLFKATIVCVANTTGTNAVFAISL